MPTIRSIYRYPIKGLSPEPLPGAALTRGETVPGDRLYAIENGPTGFDPAAPRYFPKQRFLMLMQNERLAALHTHFDLATHRLTIDALPAEGEGLERSETVREELCTAEGRAAVEQYFAAYCADELRGPPKILYAPGHSFSDVAKKVVSIINLASVSAVADMVGAPVDPLRFRGNLYVEGWPAWQELDLVGAELVIDPGLDGERHAAPVRLKVVKRIVRCAATNVDPATAIRDLDIPRTLLRHLGHADCGIYAEVVAGGEIAVGDGIDVMSDTPAPS